MSYTVENLEKSMAKITITVSAEDFEAAMVKSYNKNKKSISIQGFRRGKAPRRMIEKMYGPEIFYEDAANFAIPDAYEEVSRECDLEIVSRPEIDVVEIGNGKDFVFTATVAVRPEVTLGEYKGLEVEKKEVKIMAADVNAELERIREQNSRMVTVEDRGIEKDDTAVIDFEGFVDGEAFQGGKGDDYSLVIGSHSFIDNFEDQLIGKKAGDETEVNVTFPEDYHQESLQGKPALFKVTVKSVRRKELPELDDEFASEVSECETMDAYRAEVKKNIKERKERTGKEKKENQAVDQAIENAQMDIPEAMIEFQVRQMADDFARRIQQQGLTVEQYFQFTGMTAEKMMEEMRPQAEKRIKTRLVLEAIVKAENIEVSDERVEEELTKMAEAYQMEVEKLKEFMGENEKKQIKEDLAVQEAITLLVNESVEG